MSTPLTDAINALTQYSNSVTGQSDQTLSDAVYTLASGYGHGGISFEQIGTYTVSESWENDSLGNPVTICQTVLPDLMDTSAYNVYFLDFINNNASNANYKADCIIKCAKTTSDLNTNTGNAICIRSDYSSTRPYATGSSMWASEGTVINIYKLTNWTH